MAIYFPSTIDQPSYSTRQRGNVDAGERAAVAFERDVVGRVAMRAIIARRCVLSAIGRWSGRTIGSRLKLVLSVHPWKVTNENSPIPDSANWYTQSDRFDQLSRVANASGRLADLFRMRKQSRSGSYAVIASLAKELLERSCDHEELKELARKVPGRPDWLDPRNPGWNMPRDGWMDDVALARSELDRAVLELRALGTY